MDLTRVIIGPVVTEKAERLKAEARHTYTLHVADAATKIDVKNALRRFYDLDVESVRMIRVRSKERPMGRGITMEKRHSFKKALVTTKLKSKALDLASFKTA